MRDPYDPTPGTMPLSPLDWGPDTSTEVPTTPAPLLSYRTITTVSGVFLEDYYWEQGCVLSTNDVQLDEHNGHEAKLVEKTDYQETNRGSLSGYHYHTTRAAVSPGRRDSKGNIVLEDVFPFTVGPTFYGKVPDLSAFAATATVVKCSDPF
jgi:hypothetical protein